MFTATVVAEILLQAVCGDATYKPKLIPMSFTSSLCTMKALFIIADNTFFTLSFTSLILKFLSSILSFFVKPHLHLSNHSVEVIKETVYGFY